MDAILVPVKKLDRAKLRLGGELDATARRALSIVMLADVLKATQKWEDRFVVSDDSDAEAVALAFGCTLVPDSPHGLNAAIALGLSVALQRNAEAVLVLPADVPLVTADDVSALFAADEDVAIAGAPDGGTNGLRLKPPTAISPRFGPESASAHVLQAARAGRSVCQMDLMSLRLDIDGPQDLHQLSRANSERDSVRQARELVRLTHQAPEAGGPVPPSIP